HLRCPLAPCLAFPTRRSSDLAPLMAAYPPMSLWIGSIHSFVRRVHEAEAVNAPMRGLCPNGDNMERLCASIVLPCHLVSNAAMGDRKSTRLNSSHVSISYAVF